MPNVSLSKILYLLGYDDAVNILKLDKVNDTFTKDNLDKIPDHAR